MFYKNNGKRRLSITKMLQQDTYQKDNFQAAR